MKKIFLGVIMILAGCGQSESEDIGYGLPDDSDSVAVLTGKTIVECLIEKYGASSEDDHLVDQFKNSVTCLAGNRVIIRGNVGEVSRQRFTIDRKKVIVAVGRSAEQTVNVKFLIRKGAENTISGLRVGQEVVFEGRVSDSWDFLTDLVVEDAVVVDLKEYKKMSTIAERRRDFLLGDCLIRSKPFGELGEDKRSELFEMAKCANSAYPNTAIPSGYRSLSRKEWNAVVAQSQYSADIYSEDGYIVFGNGLRGRVFVDCFSDRAVVAWSGCDLSPDKIRQVGMLDLLTCAKHLVGEIASQHEQALTITKGVIEHFKDDVWIVGHSLGGCITTYLSSQIEEDPYGERVKFATFNGLGIGASMADEMSSERRNVCARRLTNVYCTEDIVFNAHNFTGWTGIPPRHFGQSYFIKYRASDKKLGMIEELLWHHGMDEMCRQIEYYCPNDPKYSIGKGCLITLFGIVLILGVWLLIRVFRRFRFFRPLD